MLIICRRQFNYRIFREVIMVVRWTICCHRNAIIFDRASTCLSRYKETFKDEFVLITLDQDTFKELV
jgi:hypothetical protein